MELVGEGLVRWATLWAAKSVHQALSTAWAQRDQKPGAEGIVHKSTGLSIFCCRPNSRRIDDVQVGDPLDCPEIQNPHNASRMDRTLPVESVEGEIALAIDYHPRQSEAVDVLAGAMRFIEALRTYP